MNLHRPPWRRPRAEVPHRPTSSRLYSRQHVLCIREHRVVQLRARTVRLPIVLAVTRRDTIRSHPSGQGRAVPQPHPDFDRTACTSPCRVEPCCPAQLPGVDAYADAPPLKLERDGLQLVNNVKGSSPWAGVFQGEEHVPGRLGIRDVVATGTRARGCSQLSKSTSPSSGLKFEPRRPYDACFPESLHDHRVPKYLQAQLNFQRQHITC
ncbi:hypothetical protein C2E23DRAFT_614686 [Lenzites betulinus]|nr:hypothetical protein C2E23DRAFT_614686 [Lenzites betulinus]